MAPQDPPPAGPPPHKLPDWVITLVAAIQESEDTHPKYYGDFHTGLLELDRCPESVFLDFIPRDVLTAVRAAVWAAPATTSSEVTQ